MPQNSAKQAYLAPVGRRLGTVSELTRTSGLVNSDQPSGPNNTAYCAEGSPLPECNVS